MELHVEARREVRSYYMSSLGLAGQKYEGRAAATNCEWVYELGDETVDLGASPGNAMARRLVQSRMVDEVVAYRAVERTLWAISHTERAVLRSWATPRTSREAGPDATKARDALGEMLFVAQHAELATRLCGEPTQAALRRLSKHQLTTIATESRQLVEAALAAYDEARKNRIAAERDEAAERRRLEDRRSESEVRIADSARHLFTAEEANELREMWAEMAAE